MTDLSGWTQHTTARLVTPGRGLRPTTQAALTFQADHAAAVDTVAGQVDPAVIRELGAVELDTQATDLDTYLRRPDLGRRLSDASLDILRQHVQQAADVTVLFAGGLSAEAINAHLSDTFLAFQQSCRQYGLSLNRPCYIHRSRVGVMDHIGELLQARLVILFIGERPGLANAASLSAYYCLKPRAHTVEADRAVLSNIHAHGTPPLEAGAYLGKTLRHLLDQA